MTSVWIYLDSHSVRFVTSPLAISEINVFELMRQHNMVYALQEIEDITQYSPLNTLQIASCR